MAGFDRSRFGKPREVSGGRDWPQDAELVEIAEGETWAGIYIGTQPPTGKMQSAMHYFRDDDGNHFKKWGSTVLDQTFAEDVKEGDGVEITNLGKKTSKKSGREYNAWKVVAFDGPTAEGDGPQPGDEPRRPAPSEGGSRGNPGPAPRPRSLRAERDDFPAAPPDEDDIPF